MVDVIANHLDVWTSAQIIRKTVGRGRNGKHTAYGVKKLRELILELAVRGKLVQQDPSDEPASDLLKKIAGEKARLIKEGKIKKQTPLSEISEGEKSFELPEGWEWTRLGTISVINPRNEAEDKTLASFVPMTLITTSHTGEHGQEDREWGSIKTGYTHFADGDIGLAKITPCFENSKAVVFLNLNNGIGAGTTELHIARPYGDTVCARYILLYLKAPEFLLIGETKMTGTAGQKRVPKDFFAENPLPLPPLAEQYRIVTKVDELMTLCDQLEQQQTDSNAAHKTLVEALLDTLTQSADQTEFVTAWRRIAGHFDALFTSEQSIDQLKQTILQLAIVGKLVPQDPNDAPASFLLEKIAVEKARLIKDGKNRKQIPLPAITDEDKQYELPEGWEFARFGDITFNRDAERIPLSVEERSGRQGEFDYYGASGVIDSIDEYLFDKPLLLIGEDGANLVNRSTPIAFMARGKYWVNNHAHVLDGLTEDLLLYICLHINAISLESYITGTAQPKMNQAKMNSIVLGLPPLEEQHRIIGKVDELMVLCDALKARLNEAQTTQIHLADAIVEQAVG